MVEKKIKTVYPTTLGVLIGFTKRWNPFSSEIFARVEVDSQIINVPIDHRQQSYIQLEYPVNSITPLTFYDGQWHITSNNVAVQKTPVSMNMPF